MNFGVNSIVFDLTDIQGTEDGNDRKGCVIC